MLEDCLAECGRRGLTHAADGVRLGLLCCEAKNPDDAMWNEHFGLIQALHERGAPQASIARMMVLVGDYACAWGHLDRARAAWEIGRAHWIRLKRHDDALSVAIKLAELD